METLDIPDAPSLNQRFSCNILHVGEFGVGCVNTTLSQQQPIGIASATLSSADGRNQWRRCSICNGTKRHADAQQCSCVSSLGKMNRRAGRPPLCDAGCMACDTALLIKDMLEGEPQLLKNEREETLPAVRNVRLCSNFQTPRQDKRREKQPSLLIMRCLKPLIHHDLIARN